MTSARLECEATLKKVGKNCPTKKRRKVATKLQMESATTTMTQVAVECKFV